MPPSSAPLAVVIDQPRAPFAPDRRIVAARDQARVLDRDHRLVVVAVQRPGLDLALGAFAAVQQLMERMQAVIAPRADVAQRRFQLVGRHAASQHDLHAVLRDLPAGGLDAAALGRAVDQDRIGVVDVHEDASRGKALRAPQASRPRRRSACGPCGGRSFAGAGADHFVVGEERAVEQDRRRRATAAASLPASTAAAPGT